MTKATCSRLHTFRLLALIVSATWLITAFSVRPVLGLSPDTETSLDIQQVTQRDLDGDGDPDVTLIASSFATAQDTVTVYDRDDDMIWSELWQEATDFDGDMWLFDAASDGSVELVIDFQRTEEGLVAELWDDQDGDGTVAVTEFPALEVEESLWASVRVVTPDGWWTQGDRTNYNLTITVDGPIRALHQAHLLWHLESDGVPDFFMEVKDLDGDGRPDLHWIDVWPEGPRGWGYQRTLLMVNPMDDEPPVEGAIFWPYLGSAESAEGPRGERDASFELTRSLDSYGFSKDYGVSHPPIQMSWQQASLAYVGEFVASRFNDENWFVYSNERAVPGEVSLSNFEAPFAFYDLARDDDGYPELAIRFEQYRKGDTFARNKHTLIDPIQIVRYTWDQDNNRSWDYKLALVGRHPVTETVNIQELDLILSMPEPDDLPQWIIGREWDGMTFVAAEYDKLWTSEGIYDWGISEAWFMEYVTGRSDKPPSADFLELPPRLRGEVAFDQQRQPTLYLSPVDQKWHLLGADRGQWQLDDTSAIRYESLGGDHINRWSRFVLGREEESIYQLSDFVIHHDTIWDTVRLFRVGLPPALTTVTPPTNPDEWRALNALTPAAPGAGHDFAALTSRLGAPEATLLGADIRDVRLFGNGFRFILDLKENYAMTGESFLPSTQLAPGSYVMRYDGEFHITSVETSRIAIDVRALGQEEEKSASTRTLYVELRNEGSSDLAQASLVVTAEKDGEPLIVARQEVELQAGARERLPLMWRPSANGEWRITTTLQDMNGEPIATEDSTVMWQDAPESQIVPLLSLTTAGGWHSSAFIVLAGLCTLLALLISGLWSREI